MKLEEIQTLWDKDSEIDRTELGEESLRIPQLHAKYFKLYTAERMQLKRLEKEYALLHKIKYEYYNGTLSREDLNKYGWEPFSLKVLKTDLGTYLDGDTDIHSAQLKIEFQKEKIDFLESIIKSLNGRGFQIKAAIDWIKFQNGL